MVDPLIDFAEPDYCCDVLFLADYRYDDWHSEGVLNVSF